MENSNKYTIDKLNNLIDMSEDGKEGYENAAENVKDAGMKSSFSAFANERAENTLQLRQIVQQLNGDAEDKGGDSTGTLHRVWIDLKSVFTGGDTDAIINACITGEEAAIKEYKSVLDDAEILESCKFLVGKQLSTIEQALMSIKAKVHQKVD